MTTARIAALVFAVGGVWLAALGAWYAAAGLLGVAVVLVAFARR